MAQGICDDSHGLIFGLNRFISLILQSLLTFILTDENGLALDERPQFFIYGIYFLVVGLIFGIAAFAVCQKHRNQMEAVHIEENSNALDFNCENENSLSTN